MLVISVYRSVHCRWREIPFVMDYPLNPKHASEIICQFHMAIRGENCYSIKVLWKIEEDKNLLEFDVKIRIVVKNNILLNGRTSMFLKKKPLKQEVISDRDEIYIPCEKQDFLNYVSISASKSTP